MFLSYSIPRLSLSFPCQPLEGTSIDQAYQDLHLCSDSLPDMAVCAMPAMGSQVWLSNQCHMIDPQMKQLSSCSAMCLAEATYTCLHQFCLFRQDPTATWGRPGLCQPQGFPLEKGQKALHGTSCWHSKMHIGPE